MKCKALLFLKKNKQKIKTILSFCNKLFLNINGHLNSNCSFTPQSFMICHQNQSKTFNK